MKKTIIVLSVITVISLTGCSKTEVEKNPVVVSDVISVDDEIQPETSQEALSVEEVTNATEAISAEKEDDNLDQSDKPAKLTISIEGMNEEINGLLHEGNGYEIVYDSDNYKYSDKDGVDYFIVDNSDPAIYPDIYLCINNLKDKSASDYLEKLSETLSANGFQSEITKDASIGDYKGTIVTAQSGLEWNSIIRNYYIIENDTSIYTIEAQYFVEASEGFGSRIQAMLNTFKIK
ncbi:MAG: hypothetical protein PHY47_04920 [Lachnospiraceae bacterium]|nr:hypothetical protein [Lachnospiraceae bacterium]